MAIKKSACVGIFWIFKGKLLHSETALADGVAYGDAVNGRLNHIDYWPILQRQHPGLIPLEYLEIPRGRVIFHRKTRTFQVFMDKALCTARNKRLILKAFHLPKNRTVFRTDDPHYTTDPKALNRLFGNG